MRRATEWLARVIMLTLAGLVSLSIIGAIASIPSGSIDSRLGFEDPAPPRGSASEAEEEEVPAPVAGTEGSRPDVPASGSPAATVATPPGAAHSDWLETIAYALIALVGLAALATLILWRALGEQRRIADSLALIAGARSSDR